MCNPANVLGETCNLLVVEVVDGLSATAHVHTSRVRASRCKMYPSGMTGKLVSRDSRCCVQLVSFHYRNQ